MSLARAGKPEGDGLFSASKGWPDRVRQELHAYRPRLRDWRFWATQALVIGIAFSHVAFEATGYLSGLERLYFVPVSLLFVPVVYAALNFGFAGSFATVLWIVVITIPSLALVHRGLEQWGEVFQIAILTVMAIFVGLRVDRERSAQARAESASAALGVSEMRYRGLFESSPVAILLLDAAGIILEANPAAGTLFGGPVEGLRRRPVVEVMGAGIAQSLVGGEGATVIELTKDGSAVLLEPTLTRVTDRQGRGITQVLLRDVTEERARQAGLRAYAAHVLRGQEEERQRIARELHDEAIQNLALACRQLDRLADSGEPLPASVTSGLRATRATVENVVKGLRDFSRALRPPILEDLGLTAAIRRLLVDLTERAAIEGQLEVRGQERRLSADVELGLFRIAQEALWNVEHHSGAKHVAAAITFDDREVRLDVQDDGAGFAVPSVQDLAGGTKLGLLGMSERAELLGGRLEIRSEPGKGTVVTASIPG